MMTQSKRTRYKRRETLLVFLDWFCLSGAIFVYFSSGPIIHALGLFVFSMFFQSQIASLKTMERVDELESVVFNTRK